MLCFALGSHGFATVGSSYGHEMGVGYYKWSFWGYGWQQNHPILGLKIEHTLLQCETLWSFDLSFDQTIVGSHGLY